MLRGINKQKVFIDDDDYYLFLRILSKCKAISGFKLYAYCIMSNHIHLLIQEGEQPISEIFKRFGDTFVYWYNQKHKRCGSIFQGRYKSIPVNDDAYFITVLKYIHQNPVNAGIVSSCSDYEFSSYNSYFKTNSFVDTDFAFELIGLDEFVRIHSDETNDYPVGFDSNSSYKCSDEEAKAIFELVTSCKSTDDFKKYPKDMKKAYVNQLRREGLTIAQIRRFAGVSQRMAECRKVT